VRNPLRLSSPVFLFGLLFLSACRPTAPNLDSRGKTIVCLGDSITAGVGAGAGESYPDRLAETLGLPIVNAGVPGDTASQGLARVEGVLAQNPWLVVVELGGNDFLQRIPIESTERSLRALIHRLLDAHVVPVLVEVRPPLIGGRYGDLFAALAHDYRVPMVEALPDILADRALKSDEVHPNAEGYRRFAAAVADEVAPLVAAHAKLRGTE
jgi:lysophospholipase L1-like esterase